MTGQSQSEALNQTLIVPIDVRAFCVGDSDQTAVTEFSGITLDFSGLTGASDQAGAAIISPDNGVYRDQDSPPLESMLGRGVHLHWLLPRALMHGKKNGESGEIEFPCVPNRWLVTRFGGLSALASGDQGKSWIVESDHIDPYPPDGKESPTIIIGYDKDPNQPYRYLGRTVPADGWTEPEPDNGMPTQLRQLLGSDLTAMQAGDPLFASYLPNCRNIFGMRDDPLGDLDDSSLVYIVVGWFSRPENDPLYPGVMAESLPQQLGWTLTPDGAGGYFTQSLYFGMVRGIDWHSRDSYVSSDGGISATAGVGNSGAESLSALVAGTVDDPSQREALELMLTAYQAGVLPELYIPHPDRLREVNDQLHSARFTHLAGGSRWTVDLASNPIDATRPSQLPDELVDALTALNAAQRAYDAQAAEVDALRRQLFVDWYRYGLVKLAYDNGQQDQDRVNNFMRYVQTEADLLFDTTDSGGAAINTLNQLDAALQTAQDKAGSVVRSYGYALKRLTAPRYWRPNDPVVVLSGPDMAHRLQGIGAGALLPCRAGDTLLSSLTIGGKEIATPAEDRGFVPPAETPVPVDLWNEGWLLSPIIMTDLTGLSVQDLDGAMDQFLQERKVNQVITAYAGIIPDRQAVHAWNAGNPWLPTFMWWTARYYPAPGYDGQAADIPVDYVAAQFTLNDDGTFAPGQWTPDGNCWTYVGQSILTPFVTKRLCDALRNDNSAGQPDGDIQKALAFLQTTPLLYQGLSGFTEALLMLRQIPQLAGGSMDGDRSRDWINNDGGLFHIVNDFVRDSHRLAADPDSRHAPVRGGYLELDLTAVGVFGEKRKITIGELYSIANMRTADSEAQSRIYLPPRLSQGARLKFDFLAAQDDTVEMGELRSPVCGWMVPNHLDHALVFHDAAGTARGMVEILVGKVQWTGVPGPDYGLDVDTAMKGANPHFAALAHALASSVDVVNTLQACITQISAKTTGAARQDPALAVLLGSPICVVQATLQLELMGPPAVNQSIAAFDKDCDTASQDDPQTYITGRVSNNVSAVQFPVWLGDDDRFIDGLYGFFVANAQGDYDFTRFYSPAAGDKGAGALPPQVTLAAANPVRVLMLMEPGSKVHAVSGMLPVQTLMLAQDLTQPFLKTLSVNFAVRPVLSDNANFDLPLPVEHGYTWSWVQKKGADWHTTPLAADPSPVAPSIVPQSASSGWLQLARRSSGDTRPDIEVHDGNENYC